MNTKDLILRLVDENPHMTNSQIAERVRRLKPGAETSANSVASVKSRAKPRCSAATPEAVPHSEGAARYRSMAIGNAQNWLVRNLLGRLGNHGFSRADWEHTRNDVFGGRCAYCGVAGELEMEHAIPINMDKLGEHHLGNLVPACKQCNREKGNKDYVEFLADRPDRRKAIGDHMLQSGYRPLHRQESLVRVLLQSAHEEAGALAGRYARLLTELEASIDREPLAPDLELPSGDQA